jgi:hypothetical protein
MSRNILTPKGGSTIIHIVYYPERRFHMMAVSRLFPKDWVWVRARILERKPDKVVVEFVRIDTETFPVIPKEEENQEEQ